MARKATWQRHADPRSAYVARNILIVYYYYIYISKRVLCPSLYGKGHTLRNRRVLLTRRFPKYFPCGTKFCVLLTVQATWRNVERRIKGPIDRHASIVWSADHRIAIKPRALNRSVITAEMRRRRSHLSRQIKIEGAKSKAFYNVSLTITSGPSIVIGWLGYFQNGPRWTVPS